MCVVFCFFSVCFSVPRFCLFVFHFFILRQMVLFACDLALRTLCSGFASFWFASLFVGFERDLKYVYMFLVSLSFFWGQIQKEMQETEVCCLIIGCCRDELEKGT